jgi:Fe-S oxidoreductase
MFKESLNYEMPSCTGCKTCEMACSFKHYGEFNPSRSFIQILEKGNGAGFLITFKEKDTLQKTICRGCKACESYCPSSNELDLIIKRFIKKEGKQV